MMQTIAVYHCTQAVAIEVQEQSLDRYSDAVCDTLTLYIPKSARV